MAKRLIQESDLGDSVLCDYCNTEFKGRDDSGGILAGSYAICPLCAPKAIADHEKYGEMSRITARCPPDMTFHAWCMRLRNGDNTIRTYATDNVEDLLGG
jgi:hypothetical protein